MSLKLKHIAFTFTILTSFITGCKEEEIGNNYNATGFVHLKTVENFSTDDNSGIIVRTSHGQETTTNNAGKFTFNTIPSGPVRLEFIRKDNSIPIYSTVRNFGSGEVILEYEIFDPINLHLQPNSISYTPTEQGISYRIKNSFLDDTDSSYNSTIDILAFVSSSPDVSFDNYEYNNYTTNFYADYADQHVIIPESALTGTKYLVFYTYNQYDNGLTFVNKEMTSFIRSSYQQISDVLEVEF